MEPNQPLKILSDALNNETNQKLKDKKIMRRLLIISSNNSITKAKNYEFLNVGMSFLCSLYFISRTVFYAGKPFLLWTGVIASVLWMAQLFYSWAGYRKLSSLNPGEDSIVMNIEKITFLIKHYTVQKKIYVWFAPLTMFVSLPIPLFEFRKIDITALTDWQPILYIFAIFLIATFAAIFLSKKFWEAMFNVPLENAKQNLKELQD